jgi:hypothetical protein
MSSGIVNMQSCSVGGENRNNWTCEQNAQYNAENCHYVILKWKKVSYDKELNECKAREKQGLSH